MGIGVRHTVRHMNAFTAEKLIGGSHGSAGHVTRGSLLAFGRPDDG